MALSSKGIFIIAAKRTPFCHYGGPLRESPASHIFAAAAKTAIQTAKIDAAVIDNTVVGNVFFLSQCDGGKNARYCGIYSGIPIERPALCVSKACGTGIQAVINAGLDIITGLSKITLTGGTEIMSSLPMVTRNVRFGTALGQNYRFEDPLMSEFVDSYTGLSLHRIAENIAKKFGFNREEVDEFAWQSHLKWKAAQASNTFDSEIAQVTIKQKKKDVTLDKDVVRKIDSVELLNKLPVISKDGAIVTKGNSSQPADGASALIISNETSLHAHNIVPLVRVAGWATVGVNPEDTGLAAIEAVRVLTSKTGVKIDDIDLYEINDTFASQTLATLKALNIDPAKVNVSGGTLNLGNPMGATGARIITHLIHQLKQRNLKRGVAASSCGGGQGVAIMLENNL